MLINSLGNLVVDCLNECFNIERKLCQTFVWIKEDCYLGIIDQNNGTLSRNLTTRQNETLFNSNINMIISLGMHFIVAQSVNTL